MATTQTDLNWLTVDTDDLPSAVAKQYAALKAANAEARKVREAFEAGMLAAARKAGTIPEGQTLKFGYRFGRLAVAFDQVAAPKATGKGQQTVSLFSK